MLQLGVDEFADFATSHGYQLPGGRFAVPSEDLMIAWAAHMVASKSHSGHTIEKRFRGMATWFIEQCRVDPRVDGYGNKLVALDEVIRGMVAKRSTKRPTKEEVTVDKLRIFAADLRMLYLNVLDMLMLKAAMYLGVYGLLRAGEFTCPTVAGFNPARHATRADVHIETNPQTDNVEYLEFTIKFSKTDTTGRGTVIKIFATGVPGDCPVEAMAEYLRATENRAPDSALFAYEGGAGNGVPLTRARLNAEVKDLARHAGFNPANYSTHSFRRGGAISLWTCGFDADTIRERGRWQSSVYQEYLRIQEPQSRAISQALARTPQHNQPHWSTVHKAITGTSG